MSELSNRPVVTIVLATYNGERFLPALLRSLADQERKPDRIVLRDDGSGDRSVELVRDWADQNGVDLQQVFGARLGPARSFLTALQAAKPADVFLFCDQDDVWQKHKISRALEHVPSGKNAPPTLCATRLEVVDAHLKPLRLSQLPRSLGFASASCESLLTGCTMALNSAFRDLLTHKVPQHAAMHDWWCYLLAAGAKDAVLCFDPTPTVLYRQHGGNALGAGPTGWSALCVRWQRFVGSDSNVRSRQLQEFFDLYRPVLDHEAAALICQLLAAKQGIFPRISAAFIAPVHRQNGLSTLFTRFAVLANRF